MSDTVVNVMSFDVEDYFQVAAFESTIPPSSWNQLTPRVDRNTEKILGLLAEYNTQATFFVLGWVAERFPQLIKRIANAGHEVASHGMMHQKASAQAPLQFGRDISDSKKLLEDITGSEVLGYRAPSFSFTNDNLWAYDELAKANYTYSSSVYPVVHDLYGIPEAPRFRYTTEAEVEEIPMSTLNLFGKNVPISGGGFFRLYPYCATRSAIRRFNEKEGKPYIFYLHPWELDPDQPRVSGAPLKSRFRHYLNLSKVEGRLSQMLEDFSWAPMNQVFFPGGSGRAH